MDTLETTFSDDEDAVTKYACLYGFEECSEEYLDPEENEGEILEETEIDPSSFRIDDYATAADLEELADLVDSDAGADIEGSRGTEAINFSSSVVRRRSYTIREKLEILSEYRRGETGYGIAALAAKYELKASTLQGWINLKPKLELRFKATNDSESRLKRRLKGGGPKCFYPDLEERVTAWLKQCNIDGIRVNNRHIQAQAAAMGREAKLLFRASNGWLARYKKRENLTSRRETSTRTIPEGAAKTATDFIMAIKQLINEKGIKAKNIINMDQVPRYYQSEQGSTITSKGVRTVYLRKAASCHERFTVTLTISSSGTMLKPHCLFSSLFNVPKHNHHTIADTNKTGMWSSETFKRYMSAVILKRPETKISREPVLLIIDSYAVHEAIVSGADNKAYERKNIFIRLVPKNMTPLLQPLDLCVKKSFQTAFNELYAAYIRETGADPKLKTIKENLKIPSHLSATNWVWEWCRQDHQEMLKKSFVICGLTAEPFDVEKLHLPLRDLLTEDFNTLRWLEKHSEVMKHAGEESETTPNFIPEKKDSFYRCLHKLIRSNENYTNWLKSFLPKICDYIESKWHLLIEKEQDKINMLKGLVATGAEIFAAAELLEVKLIVVQCNIEGLVMEQCDYGRTYETCFAITKVEDYYMAYIEDEDIEIPNDVAV